MSVSIEIAPISASLDMYGEPDKSSAYSLSGHVSISVSSSYSIFERRRTARFLLQSVSLTFEGQSEVITPKIGYAAVRMCSITRELAPEDPVELNNEGHEDDDEPCAWNVVFNLPIPGWLPATSKFGTEEVGTHYALYATAKFINLDDAQSSSWSFTSLCSPFRSRAKSVHAEKPIEIRRFIAPPSVESSPSPSVTFLVNTASSSPKRSSNKPRIPSNILSKIQVLASVPDHVDIAEDTVPLTLRLRTKDLPEAECKRLQVAEFTVDIMQREKYKFRPSPEYLARYPLPPDSQQPPNEPLRNAHPVSTIYDVGLYLYPECHESTTRSFSVLPAEETGKYALSGNNYVFANDCTPLPANPTWYTLEATVPFVQSNQKNDKCADWAGSPMLRPTAYGPLESVRHEVVISLTCTYDIPGGDEKASEKLNFCVPVRFGCAAPSLPPPRSLSPPPSHSVSGSAPASETTMASTIPTLPLLVPYAPSLPAYSQLYDCNGDRKIDYSVPLPLYTPRSPTSPTSPSSSIPKNLGSSPNHEQRSLLPEYVSLS